MMGTKSVRNLMKGGWKASLPIIITVITFVCLVILIIVMNKTAPSPYNQYYTKSANYEKAVVTKIVDEYLEAIEGIPGRNRGCQTIQIRFLNGPMKDQEIELENYLIDDHNVYVKLGQKVIIRTDRIEGTTQYSLLYNYDRTSGLVAVLVLLTILMFIVGRLKGLRSLLGLGISLFFIFFFLLPAICRGWSPILMSVITVMVIATYSMLLLNGFSRKTFIALLSVAVGILLSALFYFIISALLSLTGYEIEEMEQLILVSRATGLKIGEILFAGVLVASIGAVLDTSISVVAALSEIQEKQPHISPKELFQAGVTVGKDIIGANSMTLILAFAGSSLATLISMMSYGMQLEQVLSSNYTAIEVIHGITGSMVVIAIVPVTAALSALLSKLAQKKLQ